jgi:ribosomal protein S12 methylthiotransferase
VDGAPGEGEEQWLGRTYGDAPEVDGVLYLTGSRLLPGELWEARIVGTRGYDLVGQAERRL